MLEEFIEFVDSVLPSVSHSHKKAAKEAIEQFKRDGNSPNYLMSKPLGELSQGDILSDIPFIYFDDNGDQYIFKTDGMVISTSCHIDQKSKVAFVPVFPVSEFHGNSNDLQNNIIFDYMYIPDMKMADKFIDFSILCSYNKKLIITGIEKERIKRVASLNQLGYYFFIIKLTVYLMRKEDDETLNQRNPIESGC